MHSRVWSPTTVARVGRSARALQRLAPSGGSESDDRFFFVVVPLKLKEKDRQVERKIAKLEMTIALERRGLRRP